MVAQQPDVALLCYWDLRRLGCRVFVRATFERIIGFKEGVQLVRTETEQIEIEVALAQLFEFEPQHRRVPAGIERELIVGQDQRLALRCSEVPSTITGTSGIPSLRAASKRA